MIYLNAIRKEDDAIEWHQETEWYKCEKSMRKENGTIEQFEKKELYN